MSATYCQRLTFSGLYQVPCRSSLYIVWEEAWASSKSAVIVILCARAELNFCRTFLSLGEIRYSRSGRDAVQRLRVSCRSVQDKLYFSQSRMKFSRNFYTFLPIWIKLRTVDVHRNILGDCDFCESWRSESHALLNGVKTFLAIFSIFCLIWMKFGKRHLNMMLIICEFCENKLRRGLFFF